MAANVHNPSESGTHRYTRGPCIGKDPKTGEERWFPTMTACKKAGFRWVRVA